jgi:hypothetical protein
MARRRIKKLISAPKSTQRDQFPRFDVESVDVVYSLHATPLVRRSAREEFEVSVFEVESILSDSLSAYSWILGLQISYENSVWNVMKDLEEVEHCEFDV